VANVTDIDIREGIKEVIQAESEKENSLLAGIRLASYQLAAFEGQKWAGVIRRFEDSEATGATGLLKGSIHALYITRMSQQLTRKSIGGSHFDNYIGYRIRYYQSFWDKGDSDNSEDFCSASYDLIVNALANSNYLGLEQSQMIRHDDLQLLASATPVFNNEMAHVLDSFLGVHLRQSLSS
jgi:hypothetical protein